MAGRIGHTCVLLKYDLDHILAAWFNATMNRRKLIKFAAFTGGAAVSLRCALAGNDERISRTAELIHQEPVFKASRKRIYEALTDAKQFHKVVQFSEAMRSGMTLGNKPTEINDKVGGSFTLFGRHIVDFPILL